MDRLKLSQLCTKRPLPITPDLEEGLYLYASARQGRTYLGPKTGTIDKCMREQDLLDIRCVLEHGSILIFISVSFLDHLAAYEDFSIVPCDDSSLQGARTVDKLRWDGQDPRLTDWPPTPYTDCVRNHCTMPSMEQGCEVWKLGNPDNYSTGRSGSNSSWPVNLLLSWRGPSARQGVECERQRLIFPSPGRPPQNRRMACIKDRSWP